MREGRGGKVIIKVYAKNSGINETKYLMKNINLALTRDGVVEESLINIPQCTLSTQEYSAVPPLQRGYFHYLVRRCNITYHKLMDY